MVETSKLNDDMFTSFCERRYFDDFSKSIRSAIEIIISDNCDHNCSYCYYRKFGHNFFNEKSRDEETILHNLDMLLNWLKEKNYYPERIELFSGEIFSSELGFKVVDKIIDYCKPYQKILIASNMSFIFDDEKIKRGDFKTIFLLVSSGTYIHHN